MIQKMIQKYLIFFYYINKIFIIAYFPFKKTLFHQQL